MAELRALNQAGQSVHKDNIRRDEMLLGALEPAVNATLERLDREKFPRRFWDHDPRLWKDSAKHAKVIENAMGWLETPHEMLEHVDALSDFVADCWKAGFNDAVLLGMGVSSLAADVCRPSFGAIPGGLKLHVLDSTLPGAIQAIEQQIEPRRTLFLICTKSGRTTETLALYRYFYGKLRSLAGERAGENFVAITDEGTELDREARHENFRAVLPGPRNAVGRYSVLSNFGMIPAALAGGDVRSVLESGQRMIEVCQCCVPSEDNPGFKLGVILGEAWKAGRDKATFITSPSIDTFADWVEQLIAESTGKEGKSIVPVTHEALGDASVYGSDGGSDRLFVYLYLVSEFDPALDTRLKVLAADGHPVIKIVLGDKPDIGREIVRWQVATATAGAVIGINPFDSPNVEESKENTRRLLVEYCASGELPNDMLCVGAGNISLYGRQSGTSLESYLESFLSQAIPRDYIAMMVFLERTSEMDRLLEAIRLSLRDRLKVATTLGYGPRFLHSAGQLHKGGANNGLFVQITGDDASDLLVPGAAYSFATLKNAQALGDIQSLETHGRRVVRIHLAGQALSALARLQALVQSAMQAVCR